MSRTTAAGREIIATCEARTSTVRTAPARAAMKRCSSGGMMWSSVPKMNHDGIVAQAGGRHESALGSGTEVVVDLPAAGREPDPYDSPEAAEPGDDGRRGAGRRILVVEDEEAVRRLVVRVLSDAGYSVTEAVDPEEALAEREASREAFDLLLTDVVTPRMSGVERRDRVRESHLRLPVLFMSGYAEEVVLSRGLEGEHAALLPKPFSRETLLSAVAEALR